jgi:hypothetical protein
MLFLHRIEPELRTICIALDVNVRWLSAVRRIKEEPVGALATNGRHWMSLLFSSVASPNSGLQVWQFHVDWSNPAASAFIHVDNLPTLSFNRT